MVCVLGMSRSGTSATAAILRLLGVHLGEDDALLAPAQADNPKGFFEHAEITRLNEDILRRLGGTWREPPAFPAAWEASPELADLRRRARSIVVETFGGAAKWGWKDPRTSLTLPFWKPLVPDLRYVICVRNPGEIAASLEKRNRLSHQHSYRLWLTYLEAALRHTSGRRRLLLSYEDYFVDPGRQLQRLAELADAAPLARDPRVRASVDDWLEGELYNHRRIPADTVDDPKVPVEVKSLYVALLAAGGDDDPGESLDVLARELMRAYLDRRRATKRMDAATAAKAAAEERAAEFDRGLADARTRIAALEEERAGAARLVAQGERELADVERLRDAVRDRDEALAALSEERTAVAADLRRVARSASWRFGHRVFGIARIVRMRRSKGTSALDRALRRLERPDPATAIRESEGKRPSPGDAPGGVVQPPPEAWTDGIRATMRRSRRRAAG